MILESLDVDVAKLERRTGWSLKPQGACKAELCAPMAAHEGGPIPAGVVSESLGMALVRSSRRASSWTTAFRISTRSSRCT